MGPPFLDRSSPKSEKSGLLSKPFAEKTSYGSKSMDECRFAGCQGSFGASQGYPDLDAKISVSII